MELISMSGMNECRLWIFVRQQSKFKASAFSKQKKWNFQKSLRELTIITSSLLISTKLSNAAIESIMCSNS